MRRKFHRLLVLTAILSLFSACQEDHTSKILPATPNITHSHTLLSPSVDPTPLPTQNDTETYLDEQEFSSDYLAGLSFAGVPAVTINDNYPYFTEDEKADVSAFEAYGELDALGRCSACYANVCQDLMPTEDRGEIGMIKPSGWQTVRYDNVEGKYLYNRCHLIGFQLAGENANPQNLITGTRYLNVQGMLPYENLVADYVLETGNHVAYRVTPVFQGDELVARGVLMEGYSIEDQGTGVCFNVYCFNAQPGIGIDYATGDNWDGSEGLPVAPSVEPDELPPTSADGDPLYVLNTRSQKFHVPTCASVDTIKEYNRQSTYLDRETLIQEGYAPCGSCRP